MSNEKDNNPKVDPNDLHFHLPVERLGQPTRNGTVYPKGSHFNPAEMSFESFLEKLFPEFTEEQVVAMVAQMEFESGMPRVMTCSIRKPSVAESQTLLKRLKKFMGDVTFITPSELKAGLNKELEWDGCSPPRLVNEVDIEINMLGSLELRGDVRAHFIKRREPSPWAEAFVASDIFEDLEPSDCVKSSFLDRDVACMYLTPTLPLPRDTSPVCSVSFEPSFGSDLLEQSAGCRRLMGLLSHRQRHVSGDITVNGKQRKELVSNAQGTMVFPRAKQKFGRR